MSAIHQNHHTPNGLEEEEEEEEKEEEEEEENILSVRNFNQSFHGKDKSKWRINVVHNAQLRIGINGILKITDELINEINREEEGIEKKRLKNKKEETQKTYLFDAHRNIYIKALQLAASLLCSVLQGKSYSL
jgi:hypothetical protein